LDSRQGIFKILVSSEPGFNRRERLSRKLKVTRLLSSVRQVSAICGGCHCRGEPIKPDQGWAFDLP
jgi:hypothetical protein